VSTARSDGLLSNAREHGADRNEWAWNQQPVCGPVVSSSAPRRDFPAASS
jgi:hypothetical protein